MSENAGTIYYTVEADTAKLLSSSTAVDASLDGLNKRFGQTDKAARGTEMQMTKTAQAVLMLGRDSSVAARQLSNLTKMMGGFVAVQGISGLIGMAEAYGEMAERIQTATESEEEFNHVQKRLSDTAQGTYRALSEAQEIFLQTNSSLKAMGLTTDQALDATDSLSYAFVRNATATDRANIAIGAYSRALSKGRVDSDAWEMMLIAVPTLADDMAKSLGITAQEVRQLGVEGKLATTQLVDGLIGALGDNKAASDAMAVSIRDAFTNLRTNLATFLGEANNATGATAAMAQAIDFFGQNIDTVVKLLGVAGAAALASYVQGLGKTIIAQMQSITAARAQAAEELRLAQAHVNTTRAALAHAQANAGITASHSQATAAAVAHDAALRRLATAQTAATGVMRGMLGVLGGPGGIIAMLAIGALSFVDFGSRASEAGADIDKLSASIGELTAKQVENEAFKLDRTIEELTKKVSSLATELSSTTRTYDELSASGRHTDSELKNVRETISDVSVELEENQGKLLKAIELQGQLADRAAELAMETSGAAAAQQQLNAALAGFSGESGKYLARMQERTAAMQDGNSAVKQAERYLSSLTDVSDGYRAAVMSQAHAQDALRAAQERTNKGRRSGASATSQATKNENENKKVIDGLKQSLIEASLQGEQLAIAKARASLNKFATPEEIAQVEALASAVYKATEAQRQREAFGTGKKADEYIMGNSSPLSGGAFDDQYARYEAEAVAEQERYAAQLERLTEARELQIETQRSYNELEAQAAADHADRMAQIEQAKNQVILSSASDAFGALADVMKKSQGEQSGIYKAMFAASKAFAIAESIVKIQQGIAAAASLPFPANLPAMAQVVAATAGIIGTISSTTMGSGKQYGGAVAPGKMYRINETGAPEVLNTASGQQFLLPNARGQVVSNKDAVGGVESKAPPITINIHNAPEGTRVEQRQIDREYIIDVMVGDAVSEGRFARVNQGIFGLQRHGR